MPAGRNDRGRVPDASRMTEFEETDGSRTRPLSLLPDLATRRAAAGATCALRLELRADRGWKLMGVPHPRHRLRHVRVAGDLLRSEREHHRGGSAERPHRGGGTVGGSVRRRGSVAPRVRPADARAGAAPATPHAGAHIRHVPGARGRTFSAAGGNSARTRGAAEGRTLRWRAPRGGRVAGGYVQARAAWGILGARAGPAARREGVSPNEARAAWPRGKRNGANGAGSNLCFTGGGVQVQAGYPDYYFFGAHGGKTLNRKAHDLQRPGQGLKTRPLPHCWIQRPLQNELEHGAHCISPGRNDPGRVRVASGPRRVLLVPSCGSRPGRVRCRFSQR
eukprot:gene10412-biopygen15328